MQNRVAWQLGQLDALRGVAILAVMMVHAGSIHPDRFSFQSHMGTLLFAGQRGVQLFYIVSAFTLALSEDHRRVEHRPTVNFFIRRFFRIAPMFYLSLILTRILYPSPELTWKATALAAVFLNGFHPVLWGVGAIGAWSVADEAIFYMLLPFIFLAVRSLRSALIALTVTTLVSRALIGYLSQAHPQYASYWSFVSMIAELPVFLSGIAAFYAWKDLEALPETVRRSLSAFLMVVAGLGFTMLLPFTDRVLVPTSLCLALVLISLLLHPWRLLVNQVTIFVGKISFSVYLIHFYVNNMVRNLLYRHAPHLFGAPLVVVTFVLLVVLTLPVSTVTWLLVEKSGIQAAKRLIAALEHRKKVSLAVPSLSSMKDIRGAQI